MSDQENGTAHLSWAERRKLREEGIEETFPDGGMPCRIRSVDMGWFLMRAGLEDYLTPLVQNLIDLIEGRATQDDLAKREQAMTPQEMAAYQAEMLKMRYEFAKYALVYPKVVDHPQADDEVSIDDISYINARWLWYRATQPLEALASFRRRPAPDVDAVDAEPGPGRKTKRPRQPN